MDPKGSTMIAPVDMINLRAKRMEEERGSRAAEVADRQKKIAEYSAAEGKVTRDNEALKTQIEELKNDPTADPGGTKAASLNARMDANNAWLDGQYETIWGQKKTSGTQPPSSSTQPPPETDKTIPNLVQKYSVGLTPAASTNYTGGAQALQNGMPLSDILSKLANSQDLKPSDKTAIASALIKLNEELHPILQQTQQQNRAASKTVDTQSADTWKKEHPIASSILENQNLGTL
jgi:hypothetical protein